MKTPTLIVEICLVDGTTFGLTTTPEAIAMVIVQVQMVPTGITEEEDSSTSHQYSKECQMTIVGSRPVALQLFQRETAGLLLWGEQVLQNALLLI